MKYLIKIDLTKI